ncbi:MAG TPA: hypothetical protein PLT79_12590 [Flavobacterium sp.]|jgi:hypothetical protein|uniref:hypothetical protein n=1 Tax=Flavobacterium sp. TaxID=239 RepID=UPI002B97235E|nr:hypothetical protein [Flavobacterium sp.]HRL72515.1 hypothetical protein [Flavobacterium sp.]HRM46700.1 hypothetical protein [Flavobacterium sp.]
MKTKIVSGIAIVMLSFFISCDSSNDGNDNNPTLTAKDIAVNSKIDVAIDDVVYIVEDQYTAQQSISNRSSTASKSILPTCATFTTVLVDGTWTRTIDFGSAGCTLPNGNVLKGKIIISFSNDFTSKSRTLSYRFVDFYHNGKLLQGNKSITYESKSTELLATEHPVMTFTVDMKITFDDGKVYSRTGTTVKETIEGNETPLNWEDNVFLVTGNSATSLANGDTVTTVITTPLRYITSCKLPFPVSGIVSITKNTSVGTLDFGDGKCDNLATLTIDGVTKDIILEK